MRRVPGARCRAQFQAGPGLVDAGFFDQGHDGDLDVEIALLQRCAGRCLVGAGRKHRQAHRAQHQLGVGGLQVYHQVAIDLVQTHHQRAREGVQGDLLRGAGFQARAAGNDFAAGVEGHADLRFEGDRGVGIVGEADCERTSRARRTQGAQHIRRRARGGQQQHDVVRCRVQAAQVSRALGQVILRAFDGGEHGGAAAGQQGQGAFMGPGKCWVEFDAIEHAKAARGAGADVQQASARFDARQCSIDGGGNLGRRGAYCVDRIDLIVDQHTDQVPGRVLVQLGVLRIGGFGF
jgi:hypothetical protein